ncbi:hypothetical protein OVA29_08115 [Exiguobacterium sp. SL14]|nr:hypothetical protein [Exiguobacterium sp. SL14]MCY1690645.1 hypothetical protein [Exiguobacterium sp. SL14]
MDYQLRNLKMELSKLKGSLILGNEGTSSHMNRNARNELHLHRHPSLEEVLADVERIRPSDIEGLIQHIFSEELNKGLYS